MAAVKEVVRDSAIEDTIENLEDPPGRKVTEAEKQLIDSIQLLWNPLTDGILLDTARIYHNDSTVVNPLLTIVTGKVTCCSGITGNIDNRDEKIGRKIRDAEVGKVPYMLIIGDKEQAAGAVAVRLRSGEDLGAMPVDAFVERARADVAAHT